MADRKETLTQILDELNEVLERSPDVGDAGRGALERAAADVRLALESEHRPEDDGSESLVDRLNEALERFEGSHPRLTELVGRVADALSDIGI